MDHKKVRTYMEALEDERRKIQVFQRELPLCMELVSQAIDTCKKQLSEAPSMGGCVLEEFMPTRSSSGYDDDHNASSTQIDKDETMSDWLRSASLWNPSTDDTSMQTSHQVSPSELKHSEDEGTACSSVLERDETAGRIDLSPDTVASALPPPQSAATTEGKKSGEKQEDTKHRKQRRNWSPELHRRFVHALQQLGGSQVATPKQIKEVMKVDGLTNDEIKSHLQKYRVYTIKRKVSSTKPPSRENYNCIQHPQTQFIVVGGMWVNPPPPAPSSVVSVTSSVKAAEPNRLYTPVAVRNYRLPEETAVSNTRDVDVSKSATASSSNSTRTITVCCS